MGFAAGFAAGYEAVDKGRREEEARQKASQDAADKVAEAKKKDMVTATSNTEAYDKQALEYENKILNSKDDTEYNAHVTSLKSLMDNRVKLLSAAEKAGFSTDALDIMKQGFNKQYEPITKTEIPTYDGGKKEVYLPQSLASQSNNLNLSETGTIGKAILGSDNKIVGYQPTEIQPIKFKPSKDMFTNGLSLYTPKGDEVKAYSQEEADSFKKQGFDRVKPKEDKGTTVNVMGEGKPIEVANNFGTYYADAQTGEPIKKDGKPIYKSINSNVQKIYEQIDGQENVVNGLNNMLEIVNKNTKVIGSIGEDPVNYLVNYANDYLQIPTEQIADRTTVAGQSGVIAAMLRKANETGVMTEADYARYKKLVPSETDSSAVFQNKVKTLISAIKDKTKNTKEKYGNELPLPTSIVEQGVAKGEAIQKNASGKKKSLDEIFK